MSTAVATAPAPATPAVQSGQLTKEAYKGKIHPDWCPGCGDFSVLSALQTALFELGLKPHQVLVVSGIGCSSNLPGFINAYGMHTLHGRSLAVATGAKLGNHELKVICTGGDGDGYGIGGNHFLHTMRRNVDLTYIVMDNQIYGLTTGQVSPTSVKGMKTKSTPHGSVENPINPVPMSIVGGATYVARAFSGKQKHMVDILKGAIQHKGFALVDVFSPCVTYNKDNTYQWFNPRVKILEEQGHDPADFHKAIARGYQWGDEIPIGLFWKRTDLPSLEDLEPVLHDGNGPLAHRKLGIAAEQAQALVTELL
ncbi:MAG: 2-oxoacid:ferredoxin oxidoreductase subunit beta [Verrucomicrobia bacterium]|nr:MAG: 2-oxoacid:ferredoxin oxidoreductase subunit beta [Verrucomicrobiota bacterium]